VKISFNRKSIWNDKNEDANINKEYLQTNETGKSNIRNPEKKSGYCDSSLSDAKNNNSLPLETKINFEVCFVCKKLISEEIKKAERRWNLNTNQSMCTNCYERKSKEFQKINNYCNECNKKLGFIRYNPKPVWAMKGQLCRSCWDSKNSTFK
jgi:hypothetical protein